ncbi:TAXI family TRAP transporter solute-binding subunit [Desulfitibacter alkalitolerans]|uniref:TAXI family TRAP transporter solute-binding subunit n=1 Tax=Desulfitibacter alkalitolerans TaxID=264641 RepID=UPI000482F61E|nr:TAXI family TRAP transporter solute-binding subunit [Desulfitibacter alkalitolerans]
MRLKKNILLILVSILVIGFFAVGCGGDKKADENGRPQEFIKIATGNTGGTYYPVGVAMGQLFNQEISYVTSSAMSTGGSVDNIGLLRSNEAQVATMMATVCNWAFFGEGEFADNQYDDIRAITSLWPNLNHIVVLKDIKSFDDLKGKRFVVGAARSGTETDSYAILSTMGLYYRDEDGDKKNVEPVWVNYAEAVEAMKNRQVAGGMFNTFPPGSAVADLMATGDVHILSLTDEQVAMLSEAHPLYTGYTIPAGTYPNQPEDVRVCGYPNILATSAQVPEETVYDMTKAIFENLDFLETAHQATKFIQVDTATKGVQIPFHDGAIRYLKEHGAWNK